MGKERQGDSGEMGEWKLLAGRKPVLKDPLPMGKVLQFSAFSLPI